MSGDSLAYRQAANRATAHTAELDSARTEAEQAQAAEGIRYLRRELDPRPVTTMAERIRAAEAEEAALCAWRNQPETEGASADLDAELTDKEAGE